MTARYTGQMQMDKANGKITGILQDEWGWKIHFTAEKSPEGGYSLKGELGETPSYLTFPLLDGPP